MGEVACGRVPLRQVSNRLARWISRRIAGVAGRCATSAVLATWRQWFALYGEHDLPLRVSEDPCCADGRTFARPEGGCIAAGLAAFLGFSTLSPENEKTLRSASATTHVHADMPPYLLVHGTRDFGVPFEQSVSLQQTMLRAGADCTLVPVVGGGHGGWTAPSMQHYRTDVERWLRAKLRLTAPTPQNR